MGYIRDILRRRKTAQQTAAKKKAESKAVMGVTPKEAGRWRDMLSRKTTRFSKKSKTSAKS